MKGRPRKSLPRDPAQLAKAVFDQAVGEVDAEKTPSRKEIPARAKGGNARAVMLTPEQRTEIARIAANARWKKARESEQ